MTHVKIKKKRAVVAARTIHTSQNGLMRYVTKESTRLIMLKHKNKQMVSLRSIIVFIKHATNITRI